MISVVIPLFNESLEIKSVITDLLSYMKSHFNNDFEIIIINDGSNNGIEKHINKIQDSNIIIIENLINLGYGYSLKKGISKAKYDDILIIDADGTYPIKNIKNMYKVYKNGFDLVIASRGKSFSEDSFTKAIFRKILRSIVEFTSGNTIPDVNSGMRLFSARTIKPYFNFLSNRFSFTTSMTLLYALDHKLIHFEENGYNKRIGYTKVNLRKDILRTLQIIIEIIALKNPLKLHLLLVIFSTVIFTIIFLVNYSSSTFNGIFIFTVYVSILVIQLSIAANAIQNKNK